MKHCKKCGAEVAKGAKHCTKCGAKQGFPTWGIVLIVILLIAIIGGSAGGNDSSKGKSGSKSSENIEYKQIDIDVLEDALEENAAAAKEEYNGKYFAITGRLGTIDSDLKYISLLSVSDKYDIVGVHCSIKNQETKDVVKSLKKDQTIVVKGKITDVGEVLGYYLDIDSIEVK